VVDLRQGESRRASDLMVQQVLALTTMHRDGRNRA
jgi:hypothetical protein